MAFESCVAGEGAVALTADVAAHACVDLHVLLECALCLKALPTQQTEDSHVRACGRQQQEKPQRCRETRGQIFTPEGWGKTPVLPLEILNPTLYVNPPEAAQDMQC